jgi:OOP family OmpA-OmpF porin
MKKSLFIFSIVFLMMSQIGLSQHKGAHAISYKFIGVDTHSPYAKVNTDGTRQFKFDSDGAFDNMTGGIEIGYHYGINDWLAVGVPFRVGKINIRQDSVGNNFSDALFVTADIRAKLSASFMPKQILTPYLSTGFGMMKRERDNIDMQLPVELGLSLRVANNFFISVGTEYRFSFDELGDGDVQSFTDNMLHSAGFIFVIGDQEETPPPPPVEIEVEAPPADTDGDGIVDTEDTCPDVAGLAKFAGCPDTDGDDIQDSADDCPDVVGLAAFKGCPDTDGDGLPDNSDDCPTEAGSLSNKGCPIKVLDRDNDGVSDEDDACPDTPGKAALAGCPDTDGDGIADKKDQCPSAPGVAKFNGCPDTDNDGVADKSDKCPTTKGTIANNGCPEIKKEDVKALTFATEGVEFETGKNIIRTSSYPSLDNVASIMAKYPNYSLSINGYTDSVGNDNNNLKLSEKRAQACFDYLMNKGVSPSRMSSAGYGEASPIADNASKEGRQRNRRVEFKIFLK